MGACIPMAIGVGASLLGKGKGKKTEYAAQAPEYQQQFSEDFMKFLSGQIGQGATPYGGQVAASASNPFTQSALGLWGASPYGQMGGGQQMPPQAPMGQLGGGLMPTASQQPQPPGTNWGQVAQMPGMFGQMGNMVTGLLAKGGQAPQQPTPPQGAMPQQRPMPQRPPQGGLGGQGRGVPFRR